MAKEGWYHYLEIPWIYGNFFLSTLRFLVMSEAVIAALSYSVIYGTWVSAFAAYHLVILFLDKVAAL
jgi:hypothetical protein